MLHRGILKEYSQAFTLLLKAADVAAITIAAFIALQLKFGSIDINQHYVIAIVLGALVTTSVFSLFQIYESSRGKTLWQHIADLIKVISLTFLILASIAFLTKTGELFSRIWFMDWIVVTTLLILGWRLSLFLILRVMRSRQWNERDVIIIGEGELAYKLIDRVSKALWTGFKIQALLTNQPCDSNYNFPAEPMPVDLGHYLENKSVDEIWIALPLSQESAVRKILNEVRHKTITIRYILDVFGFGLLNHSLTYLAGFPALNLNTTPMVGFNRLLKALEDRVLSLIILILVSPVFALIALAIKLDSSGPVIFKQQRHGWDGRVITIYKFRTMKVHQETTGQVTQAKLNDERVTRVGRLLRQTSLDELPQFFNVLQGRMSIVGPRPHAIAHNNYYKENIHAYLHRHKVKPGITGWAQINGWRGETDTLDKMEKRIEFDLYYIEHWSLWFDLKIILLTMVNGFMHRNAY